MDFNLELNKRIADSLFLFTLLAYASKGSKKVNI